MNKKHKKERAALRNAARSAKYIAEKNEVELREQMTSNTKSLKTVMAKMAIAVTKELIRYGYTDPYHCPTDSVALRKHLSAIATAEIDPFIGEGVVHMYDSWRVMLCVPTSIEAVFGAVCYYAPKSQNCDLKITKTLFDYIRENSNNPDIVAIVTNVIKL